MDPDELLNQIDDDPYEDITREDMLQTNRELIFDEDGEIVDEETFHNRLRDRGARVWRDDEGAIHYEEISNEVMISACLMMIDSGYDHDKTLEDYMPSPEPLDGPEDLE